MRVRRWVLAVGTAAAVGAGTLGAGAMVSAAASTATTTTTPTTTNPANQISAFITDLAGHLGIPVTTLESAIQQTAADQVQQAQQHGLITAAQAQKVEQRIQSGNLAALLPRMGGPGMGPRGVTARFGAIHAATQYLGLTGTQIRSDLKGGKSLDDIANGIAGKSAAGLQAAILAAAETQLQSAAIAGRITATQEQAMLNRIEPALPKMLSATHPFAAKSRPGRGPWLRVVWMRHRHDAAHAPATPPASSSPSTNGNTSSTGSTTTSTSGSA